MLLLYAPFAFLLAYFGRYYYLAIGVVVLGSMPMVPDIDMKLPIKHRGITHTVWFASGIGFFFAGSVLGVAYYFQSEIIPWVAEFSVFAFFIGNMLVYGHLLGDVITFMGIKPFYPVSDYKARIDFKWIGLPTRASSDLANSLSLIIGTVALIASVVGGLHVRGVL
jgi:inner membrane protein